MPNENDKNRETLTLKWLFLNFVYVVTPGAMEDSSFRMILRETEDFVTHSTDEDFRTSVGAVSQRLDRWIAKGIKFLQPKVSVDEIGREFGKLLNEQGNKIFRDGVSFEWLSRLIDCASLGLRKDLPYHARIGLATHAGNASTEESFLLHDAFLLLEVTRLCYEKMHSYAAQYSPPNSTDENYRTISAANQNTGSVARLCVFSFYAFVEAFVNCVGMDFAARNSTNLSPKDISILHGFRKQKYLSLEQKMEFFPRIIRQDGTSPIVLTDRKQHREPFLTFFSNIKEVRDASAHFNLGKASIWRNPQEWLDLAEKTSRVSIEVASEFWQACYPQSHAPEYLLGLDYNTLQEYAGERLNITKHILGSLPITFLGSQ